MEHRKWKKEKEIKSPVELGTKSIILSTFICYVFTVYHIYSSFMNQGDQNSFIKDVTLSISVLLFGAHIDHVGYKCIFMHMSL